MALPEPDAQARRSAFSDSLSYRVHLRRDLFLPELSKKNCGNSASASVCDGHDEGPSSSSAPCSCSAQPTPAPGGEDGCPNWADPALLVAAGGAVALNAAVGAVVALLGPAATSARGATSDGRMPVRNTSSSQSYASQRMRNFHESLPRASCSNRQTCMQLRTCSCVDVWRVSRMQKGHGQHGQTVPIMARVVAGHDGATGKGCTRKEARCDHRAHAGTLSRAPARDATR